MPEHKIFDGKQQQEIIVSLQDTFSVLLKGNPTTGFSWEVESLPEFLSLKNKDYQSDNNTHMAGRGGEFNFSFQPLNVGEGIIHLKHHRVWEKDVPPMDTVVIKLTVTN